MLFRSFVAAAALVVASTLGLAAAPRTAHATSNWDWFGFLVELSQKAGCESSGTPSLSAWNTALAGQVPLRDDMVLFQMAYPCGASPTRFLQSKAWKNWSVFGQGSYSTTWDGQPFLQLTDSAEILHDAGFWPDGPM